MAELQDRRLVGPLKVEANASKLAQRRRLPQHFSHCRIGQAKPLLHEMDLQRRSQRVNCEQIRTTYYFASPQIALFRL